MAKSRPHLVIPESVEKCHPQMVGPVHPGWDNAGPFKTSLHDLTKEELADLATAILDYMQKKSIREPGRSWQDFFFVRMLVDVLKRKEIRYRISRLKQHPLVAELAFVFGEVAETIRLNRREAKKVIAAARKNLAKNDALPYKALLREVAKIKSLDIDVDSLEERDVVRILSEELRTVLRKQNDAKTKLRIEAILLGLITAGLFEVIRYALATLVARAPYAEAQIYEIECDVFKRYSKWRKVACNEITQTDVDDELVDVLLIYTLHAICVLAVLGPNVRGTPLFSEGPDGDTYDDILNKNPPSWYRRTR